MSVHEVAVRREINLILNKIIHDFELIAVDGKYFNKTKLSIELEDRYICVGGRIYDLLKSNQLKDGLDTYFKNHHVYGYDLSWRWKYFVRYFSYPKIVVTFKKKVASKNYLHLMNLNEFD